MENPPNGTGPKSFDTNKKKRLFFSEKKTFGTLVALGNRRKSLSAKGLRPAGGLRLALSLLLPTGYDDQSCLIYTHHCPASMQDSLANDYIGLIRMDLLIQPLYVTKLARASSRHSTPV